MGEHGVTIYIVGTKATQIDLLGFYAKLRSYMKAKRVCICIVRAKPLRTFEHGGGIHHFER